MTREERPVVISGIGFVICVVGFMIAALTDIEPSYFFYLGFSITSFGVVMGFLTFSKQKSDKESD
jgi:hypothetical protein